MSQPSFWRPLGRLDHPREMIRHFTPNWFTTTMGTGVLALVIAALPLSLPGQEQVAEALWGLAVGLFAVSTLIYAARWLLFFDGARQIFTHPVVSMFLGCIPMGLATILNGLLRFGPAHWGEATVVAVALPLWCLDAGLALACGLLVPFLMFTRQSHAIEQMTAVWLLPVVAAEVAAVSGGTLAPHLVEPSAQLAVLIASYALWACSVPLALSVLGILLLRLVVYKLPPASMAASSWLALGPIATGALGLMVLGEAAPTILAANGLGAQGEAVRGLGLIGGVLLWGNGLWWAGIATLINLRHLRDGLPFNLGWWGYIFPLGVYALVTLRLAAWLPIPALSWFGIALVGGLVFAWAMVAIRTTLGVWRGDLFSAPCLAAE